MSNDRSQRYDHSQKASQSKEWPEKMKLSLARKFLGISFSKMSYLIHKGTIKYEEDPLDHRVKLVKREDLEALLRTRDRA
jgi:hypothetical protein